MEDRVERSVWMFARKLTNPRPLPLTVPLRLLMEELRKTERRRHCLTRLMLLHRMPDAKRDDGDQQLRATLTAQGAKLKGRRVLLARPSGEPADSAFTYRPQHAFTGERRATP